MHQARQRQPVEQGRVLVEGDRRPVERPQERRGATAPPGPRRPSRARPSAAGAGPGADRPRIGRQGGMLLPPRGRVTLRWSCVLVGHVRRTYPSDPLPPSSPTPTSVPRSAARRSRSDGAPDEEVVATGRARRGAVHHGARPVGHERVDQPARRRLRHDRHHDPGRDHPLLPRDGHVHADRRQDRRHHRPAPGLRHRTRHLRLRLGADRRGADRGGAHPRAGRCSRASARRWCCRRWWR